MKLLAIETCTEACSAALLLDGVIVERYELAPRRHTELILVMVDELMREADLRFSDLDGLAFGRGPGAFSGVRIGCSVVQALAFASDLPIAPVSSLAALAYGTYQRLGARSVIAAIDARMREIYWAVYQIDPQGILHELSAERVSAPTAVSLATGQRWVATGSGADLYADTLKVQLRETDLAIDLGQYPHAAMIATLAAEAILAGQVVDAANAQPVYLRNDVATPKA
jgi:tRNA threonylcarbamoyladenosine biosynthesis protein TsaB